MKTKLFCFALLLACVGTALGQSVIGAIPSTGGGASCVSVGTDGQGIVAISVTGTWTGTLQPQVAVGGDAAANVQVTPFNSSTAQATITANGAFRATVAGATQFQVCGNTVASGTANIKLNVAPLAANVNAGTGTGTVSANSGSAGALATYAAAGGSTTVGADPAISSNAAGTLTAGLAGTATGTYSAVGSTSGNVTWTCNAAACSSWQTASPLILNANGGMSLKHFNQVAATNFAGTCTMAAATTCTATINSTYTTPLCFTNVQSAAPTTFQGSCALSGTTVTVTASASNSNTWQFMVMGNPN